MNLKKQKEIKEGLRRAVTIVYLRNDTKLFSKKQTLWVIDPMPDSNKVKVIGKYRGGGRWIRVVILKADIAKKIDISESVNFWPESYLMVKGWTNFIVYIGKIARKISTLI